MKCTNAIGLVLVIWYVGIYGPSRYDDKPNNKIFLYELPMLLPSRESGESLLHPTSYVVRIKFVPDSM